MTSEPVWRQAHVVADVLLGTGIFAFAVWSILTLPRTIEIGAARRTAAG
jgi:hypothetical protein